MSDKIQFLGVGQQQQHKISIKLNTHKKYLVLELGGGKYNSRTKDILNELAYCIWYNEHSYLSDTK